MRALTGRLSVKKAARYLKYIVAEKIDQRTGIVSLLLSLYAARVFRRIDGVEEAVEFLFSESLLASLIKPMQVRDEVARLAEIVAARRPRRVLEIGTARGGTLFLWTRAAAEDATLVSVDLPGGLFGGGYPVPKEYLYRRFPRGRQRLVLIRGDSHSEATFAEVSEALGGGKVDFLFIDGDHRYEGVKRDYEMYSRLVKPGGIIAFHDIVPGPEELVGGVPRFWRELKSTLPSSRVVEIVHDWRQGGYGIGVVFV